MVVVSIPKGSEEKRSMILALGVVLLSIISIVIFVVDRSGILFYIFAAITVVAFLYMAYDLSRPRQQAPRRAAASRKRARPAKGARKRG